MLYKKTFICSIIIIILINNSFAFASSDDEAKLKDIIVTTTRNDLIVYFNVQGAFREKIQSAIMSGVPVSFSFLIDLYQVRSLWFDKKIADININHTIKYNNLKKEFIIKRSWKQKKPYTTASFQDAKELMSSIDNLKIIPLNKLKKGTQYQIRAKAELSKITLPLYLHYILFFISLWNFETNWYAINFTY